MIEIGSLGYINCLAEISRLALSRTITLISIIFSCLLNIGCNDRYEIKPTCDATVDQGNLDRFTFGEKGAATDLATGITWYRCPAGSYFEKQTCTGEPFRLSWDEAIEYTAELTEISGLAWRMATLEEVQSIIISGCVGPALNPNVFPTIKPVNVWTLSQRDNNDDLKCTIYTYNGAFACRHIKSVTRPFMLVRDEDSPNASATQVAEEYQPMMMPSD